MRYYDSSFKSVTGMLTIVVFLCAAVFVTITAWQRAVGDFSLTVIGRQTSNLLATWKYRIQFNWSTTRNLRLDQNLFLAAIGFSIPSAIPSQAADGETARAIPVLLYHGIIPETDGYNVSLNTFKEQMFFLKASGWQTVSVDEFARAMRREITLPQKSFLITFDDARKDSYYPVDPILRALDYRAVMYVITGHSLVPDSAKSTYYLSSGELSEMKATGRWDLQAHSNIGHEFYPLDASGNTGSFYGNKLWLPARNSGETDQAYRSRVSQDLSSYFSTRRTHTWDLSSGRRETDEEYESRIFSDLLSSKENLENKLGIRSVSFAYPFSDFARNAATNFPDAKFILARSVNRLFPISFYQWFPAGGGFSQNYPGEDGQLLRRIEPKPEWSADDLLAFLEAGKLKKIPFVGSRGDDDGWLETWGEAREENDILFVRARSATTGALAILDGSRTWKDYTFTTQFDWLSGRSVSIVGRYHGDPTGVAYVSCDFSNGTVVLKEREAGVVNVVSRAEGPIGLGKAKDAGMRVAGDYAECLWEGQSVTGGYLSFGSIKNGGVGVGVWGPALGDAAIAVRQISVK